MTNKWESIRYSIRHTEDYDNKIWTELRMSFGATPLWPKVSQEVWIDIPILLGSRNIPTPE